MKSNITFTAFLLLTVLLFMGVTAQAQTQPRPDILLSDFEGADYGDWVVTGEAFGTAPASSSIGGGMGAVFGHHGKQLVNTLATEKWDSAVGTLTSPEFVIERKNIVYSIGGGAFSGETGIALHIDGKEVKADTGLFSISRKGDEGLVVKTWDVSALQGKKAKIVIFDKKAGGDWGHIKVDNIYQSDNVPVTPLLNSFIIPQDAKPVEYNRMIFGQFIEHFHRQIYGGIFEPGSPLSDKDGFRSDVIAAMKELQVPIVRWPGGCFVSSYHWLDGVGQNRQPSLDKAWGVEDPNTFGTVEFVKWCRLIGAEPFICTNAGTGTAEEMSDWVEYCNLNIGKYARLRKTHGVEEPLNVKYWSIGNENYGSWELGAKTVAEWGPLVRESAKLMKAADPEIKLFAAATAGENWTLPLLQTAGNRLNYVSIHGYWGNSSQTYLGSMMRTEQPAHSIASTIAILEKAKLRGKVKIAFDEWNLRGWHHPGFPGGGAENPLIAERDKNDINPTYTMADAVFSACFLNACLRQCNDVEIGGFSPVVNTRGALFVHPKGIVKRTTFHVLKLYAEKLEKNVLPIEVTSERLVHGNQSTSVLDAVLTCNDDKTKYVLVVTNKSPDKAIAFDIGATDEIIGKTAKEFPATILSGSSPDDYNDIGAENRVVPETKTLKVEDGKVAIPPHSVVFMAL